MKLLAGLGNPGEKYKKNRHNAGFMLINYIHKKYGRFIIEENRRIGENFTDENDGAEGWKKQDNSNVCTMRGEYNQFVLLKPRTCMNDSGKAILAITKFYKINPDKILIAHDDLDIKLGEFKIQRGKGPHIHKGILSIEKALKTEDFWRVRIGIDNRTAENRAPGETYVLQNFTPEEERIIKDTFVRISEDAGFQLFLS